MIEWYLGLRKNYLMLHQRAGVQELAKLRFPPNANLEACYFKNLK